MYNSVRLFSKLELFNTRTSIYRSIVPSFKTPAILCLVNMPYSSAGCVAALERRTRNLRLPEGCFEQKGSSVSFVSFVLKFLQIST